MKIRKKRTKFSRGFTDQFTPNSYQITLVRKTFPVTYRLESLKKSYYENELVKANKMTPNLYIAEIKNEPLVLRSGKTKQTKDTQRYHIKDYNDPFFSSWMTRDEAANLDLIK